MFSLREYLDTLDHDLTILEPSALDAAVIGLVPSPEGEMALCYDSRKVIELLVADGMTPEGAQEYFEFNIEGAHFGPNAPVFLDPLPEYLAH